MDELIDKTILSGVIMSYDKAPNGDITAVCKIEYADGGHIVTTERVYKAPESEASAHGS